MSGADAAPARPSASVVVLRDGAAGLEVLLLRRNEQVAFHGGAWVFPGGRVDAADHAGDAEVEVAKRAAVRETREEAGLAVAVADMLPFAHWTTPVDLPKRFATWFFACAVGGDQAVTVDNDEIVDHRWLTPHAALEQHAGQHLDLPAPTYVTLLRFSAYARVAALTAALRDAEVQRFVPRIVPLEGGRCTLYGEDAGYASGDFHAPGPRHRLLMRPGDWQYLRDF